MTMKGLQMVNNSLTETETANTFSTYISGNSVKKKINEIIGGKDGQAFMTSIISAVSANPKLQECSHASILSSAMIGAALKLSPSPQLGQYYIVPYNKEAQFQIGYKGYIQLAIRSGYYKKLNVLAIKEGELVKYDPMIEEITVNLIEDEAERSKAETVGYYAMLEYLNGFRKTLYWSKTKMLDHAKEYSEAYKYDLKKNYSYSFWTKDFDSMGCKTMLRQLISKWGIMSIDMQAAYEEDNTALNKAEAKTDYIDNKPEAKPEKVAEQNDDMPFGEEPEAK